MRGKDSQKDWKKATKSVTMTNAEWTTLTMFLRLSAKHRLNEIEFWKSITDKSGCQDTPLSKVAEDNVKFWEETNEEINKIIELIDGTIEGS